MTNVMVKCKSMRDLQDITDSSVGLKNINLIHHGYKDTFAVNNNDIAIMGNLENTGTILAVNLPQTSDEVSAYADERKVTLAYVKTAEEAIQHLTSL